jgi:hypothetical protein
MVIEACVCTAEQEQKLAMAQAKEARSIMVKGQEEGEHVCTSWWRGRRVFTRPMGGRCGRECKGMAVHVVRQN